MKPAQQHRSQPWRVHDLAADFKLVDIWHFDLGPADGRGLEDLTAAIWKVAGGLEQSILGRIRVRVGARFGWDRDTGSLPIPGCQEHSIRERMTARDRADNLAKPDAPSPLPAAGATTVYRFADEVLYEVTNKTIHALMHVSWRVAPDGNATGVLAVYVKYRGAMSRVYMAAIWPARHAIIYPALVRRVEASWPVAARSD